MKRQSSKLQSAMEYLMTYGWAILIIGVVLVTLSSLGIFNPIAFSPRVSPGACSVSRPNGPNTTFDISLVGTCSGATPQYATVFNGGSAVYTSGSSITSTLFSDNQVTITAWVEPVALPASGNDIVSDAKGYFYIILQPNGALSAQLFSLGGAKLITSTTKLNPNTWYFISATDVNTGGSAAESLYINGALAKSATFASTTSPSLPDQFIIGASTTASTFGFVGIISNVQVYGTALSGNSITALYNEGVGGTPIDLNDLVGWWPLNGDTHDYSGNSANTIGTGIFYDGNWWYNYNGPT